MTSSRMRSGGCTATMASASSPLAAVSRTNPSADNMISSNSLFWSLSSTIRTRAGLSAMSVLGFIFSSPSRNGGDVHQVRRDRRQELSIGQRLGDVAVTPRGANALLVTLHRQRGESNYRDGARSLVSVEE